MPSTPHESATTNPAAMSDEPVPELATLSLTLTRDQGLLHSSGTGAGSDMDSLSHVAHSQHAAISPIVLSYSSSFRAAQAAMNPANLPKAPSELPRLLVVGEQDPSSASGTAASSTAVTPDHSRPGTPGSSTPSTPVNGAGAALPLVTGDKSPSAVAVPMSVSSSASSIVTNKTVPARPVVTERKSVFGKLFERNNGSTTSVASTGTSGTTTPAETGTGTAAPLTRKVSKKEKDKEDKEQKEGRPRAASNGNGYLSSSSANEKGGMGAALNEFMRNKVARKSSATSKKSDDGKSDRGSQAGGEGSQYGGSTKEESKSKSGQTTTSTLKKYGVCEKVLIGKGATAVVKLAHKWDRSTERLYAVKEFRKRRKNETEKEYVKKLTSEFCISSTLHHQNIVETVDLVQDEQSHWCEVMEYCPGGDLYAAIKKGNMGSPQINSYFKQILCGVSYLHSMGVAHRDIKPENLLLDAKGHVKITDFGVSDVFRMCWEKTTHLSKGLCGSEPYIAPEQFEQKEYDARLVDVWACAVVFYCMHFQELPWRVAKPSDPSFGPYLQMYPGSASPPPLSNLVPRECRAIIKKMLDPDPKTRVGTEMVMSDPWVMSIVVIPPLEGVAPESAPTTPLIA